MKMEMLIVGTAAAVLLALVACEKKAAQGGSKGGISPTSTKGDVSGRCPHDIKREKCPFCNPSLVESEGFCGEHGVAEALCAQCRPYLKAAFRAKGDWCADHGLSKSQCLQCNPSLRDRLRPGEHGTAIPAVDTSRSNQAAAQCEHGITKTKCPFCTPTLIESDGFCKEHDVAEALCVTCRPYLETAFKAKGDWCTEHGAPESHCVQCHPELKNKPKG